MKGEHLSFDGSYIGTLRYPKILNVQESGWKQYRKMIHWSVDINKAEFPAQDSLI